MALLPTTGRIKATDCCRMPDQPLHIFSASKIGRLTNFEQTVRLGEGSLLISFVFREEDIQFFLQRSVYSISENAEIQTLCEGVSQQLRLLQTLVNLIFWSIIHLPRKMFKTVTSRLFKTDSSNEIHLMIDQHNTNSGMIPQNTLTNAPTGVLALQAECPWRPVITILIACFPVSCYKSNDGTVGYWCCSSQITCLIDTPKWMLDQNR